MLSPTSPATRSSDQTAEESIWHEWLTLYVEHSRRALSSDELARLADAVPRGVADPAVLPRLVDGHVLTEGRFLVGFLAGVADPARRRALTAEASARLQLLAARSPANAG